MSEHNVPLAYRVLIMGLSDNTTLSEKLKAAFSREWVQP